MRPLLAPAACALVVVLLLPLLTAYVVVFDRELGARPRPGLGAAPAVSRSLLQPVADLLKLLLKKEAAAPSADRLIFWFAPGLSVAVALLAYSALSFGPAFQVADLNIGLLFILAASSLGVYGVVLGGWTFDARNRLLDRLRIAAQLLSYQTAAALAVVSALMLAGSLSMRQIVQAQYDQGTWFLLDAPVGFLVYLAASIASLNAAPSDPFAAGPLLSSANSDARGEFSSPLFYLAGCVNLIVLAGVATTLFLGGWLRPFARFHDHFLGTPIEMLDALPVVVLLALGTYAALRARPQPSRPQKLGMSVLAGLSFLLAFAMAMSLFAAPAVTAAIHGAFWFLAKLLACLYIFLRLRFLLPSRRFHPMIRWAWQFLIPLAAVNVIAIAIVIVLRQQWSANPSISSLLMTASVVGVGAWLSAGRRDTESRFDNRQAPGDESADGAVDAGLDGGW